MDISPTQEQILLNVGRYRYLTLSQMVRLEVSTYHYLQKQCKQLVDNGLLNVSYYGGAFTRNKNGIVKSENLYSLPYKTAKILEERGYDAWYPKMSKLTFTNDYVHRIATISVQIAYDRWIEKHGRDNKLYQNYLYSSGSQRDHNFQKDTVVYLRDKTRVVADFVLCFERDRIYPFIGEINFGEVRKAVEQYKTIGRALQEKAFSNKYDWGFTPRVLCILENDTLMTKVMAAMKKDPFFDTLKEVYLFSSIENCLDFDCDWLKINGSTIKLLDL